MSLELDLPELTDDQIRQQLADTLDACQHETNPFTAAEIDAIVRYTRGTLGVPDAFDCFHVDGIRAFRKEFGDAAALAMVRGHFRLIDQWQDAYTVLKLDGLPRDATGDFSPAAVRFLGRELVALQDVTRTLHAAVAAYFLGADDNGHPYGALAPCNGYRYTDGLFWLNPA